MISTLQPFRKIGFISKIGWGTREPFNLEYAGRTVTAFLRVQNEFICVEAVWKRREGIWTCIHAPAPLSWMRKLDPSGAKLELARLGWSWKWGQGQADTIAATHGLES